MYEIRCIVGEKKLREVLVFLADNNTLEPPVVVPMVLPLDNGLPKPPEVKQSNRPKTYKKHKKPVQQGGHHLKGQGALAVVRDLIRTTGGDRISTQEMKKATMERGYSPGAYSHAVKLLLADKTIRRSGLVGDYIVNQNEETKNG